MWLLLMRYYVFWRHKKAWLWQPYLIENLTKNFEKKAQTCRPTKLPVCQMSARPISDNRKFWHKDIHIFSAIGMLLYLMKHSTPDTANSLWELSKVLDRSNKTTFQKMHHDIKYTLGTKMMDGSSSKIAMKMNHGTLSASLIVMMQTINILEEVSVASFFMWMKPLILGYLRHQDPWPY